MTSKNVYDVTQWPVGNPYEDIGEVINSIIADIKNRQSDAGVGKPGSVIYIPVGDYRLTTQVKIDISFLRIVGSGHGFTSSSIRFNVPEKDWPSLHELWPGGSRIMVDIPQRPGAEEWEGAAFYIEREGDPRISSVEFSNFCIDGLHFVDDGGGDANPENTYVNGKTGIYAASPNDSFRINGMGLVYLEHGLTLCQTDALSIHDNFIAECGSCIELRDWGQASKITDNLLGAGYKGYSIYAENFGGLMISTNNVFPRGSSSICFDGVTRSLVTGNRLHSFYPGVIEMRGVCSENLISSNHILRDHEPCPPMQMHDNGLDDRFGLVCIKGYNNTVVGNHISEVMEPKHLKPAGVKPVIIRVASGQGNYIAHYHIVATNPEGATAAGDSCFSMQVGALLSAKESKPLDTTHVLVEPEASQNTVVD